MALNPSFRPAFPRFSMPFATAPTDNRSALGDAAIFLFFVFLAGFWQFRVMGPQPFVIPSGDGGNVGSIVAAGLYPERFSADPVFSDPSNFAFYLTITRPWVALNAWFLKDIGQSYMAMQFLILLVQLQGFFWLGRRLFGGSFWPLVLALVSLPPVFVFNGELWGNLPAPLTRSVYGAVFPYLILVALPPFAPWRPVLAMALSGVAVYVHPVSAPSVALAIWMAMALTVPWREKPARSLLSLTSAGMLFVAIAVPFAVTFVPTMVHIAAPLLVQLQQEAKAAMGAQYYDAMLAVSIALEGGGNNPSPSWGWVYGVWTVSLLFIAGIFQPLPFDRDRRFFLVLFIGLLLSSAGVAWLDQAIAARMGRGPAQVDLIRNLRFALPLLLVACVWLLAQIQARFGQRRVLHAVLYLPGVALAFAWWFTFPTPVGDAVREWSGSGQNASQAADDQDFRRILSRLRNAPANSVTLPLPAGAFETQALAIRYGALQPVLYTLKDMNFLLYSASKDLGRWAGVREMMSALEQRDTATIRANLQPLVAEQGLRFVLIDQEKSTKSLDAAISELALETMVSGKWHLYQLRDTPHQ